MVTRRSAQITGLGHEQTVTPKYSVVIPVYNSARYLQELHARLRSVMDRLNEPYEILFVNDASPDDSLTVLRGIQDGDDRVVVVDLMRNFGQHNAVVCGFESSAGEFVVTMDDDLQHPPEEIPKLIAAMQSGEVDVVIGRYIEKRHSPARNVASWLMKRLSWHTVGVPQGLKLNSFRLMRRRVADAVVELAGAKPRVGLMIFQITRRITNVDVEHHARRGERTSYRPHKLISAAIDNVVNYSSLPLRLLAYGGFLTSATAIILAMVYLVRYLAGDIRVAGFTTLVILLLFFMGLTMCAFGIVGEYLVRIVWAAERRPPFVVRETFRSGEREPASGPKRAHDPRSMGLT